VPIQSHRKGRFWVKSVPHLVSGTDNCSDLKGVDMTFVRARMSFLAVLLVVVALFAFQSTTAIAQDATPGTGTEPAHPVHIHTGSCDALGDVVVPLNDIVTYNITNSFSFSPAATPEANSMATPPPSVSATQTTPVLSSVTRIDGDITDFATGGFAINAHESMENIQNYIACGNIPACTSPACSEITGVSIVLSPLNDSGYLGVARIDVAPNGGLIVSVFLFQPDMSTSS